MRKLIFLILLLNLQELYSQSCSGIIYDADTKQPLPYVSIGVLNRGTGTVAQQGGQFTINLPDELNNDTLKISMIGYQSQFYNVLDFKTLCSSGKNIYLKETVSELSEVIIRPKDTKTITVGNEFDIPNFRAGFTTNDLGSELGTVMKVKHNRTYFLKTAVFNIALCNYDSILFRVNIYDFEDGKPGVILQSLPLYVKAVKDQKQIILDLTSFNISVDHDFVMSLEWIMDLPDKEQNFLFCAGLIGNRIFYRKTSQDTWNTYPIGIGNYCEVEYEK